MSVTKPVALKLSINSLVKSFRSDSDPEVKCDKLSTGSSMLTTKLKIASRSNLDLLFAFSSLLWIARLYGLDLSTKPWKCGTSTKHAHV